MPACNFAQTACQAALHVAERLGDDLANARAVLVRVSAAAMRYPGCDFAGPFQRALQAKMSIQFGVAAALQRKAIAEENYQRLADAGILRLISLTRLEEDEAFTQRFPAAQGAEVRVSLADGSLVMDRLDDVVPATTSEIRARFRAAAATVVGSARAAEIEAFVDGLEEEPDAGRVAALCGTAAAGSAIHPEKRAGEERSMTAQMVENFLQALAAGLTVGAIYGLMCVGLALDLRRHARDQFRAGRLHDARHVRRLLFLRRASACRSCFGSTVGPLRRGGAGRAGAVLSSATSCTRR